MCIDYTAEIDSAYFTPAEGVTYRIIEQDVQRPMNGSIDHQKVSQKHEFEIKKLNTKVTVCITEADVDIEYSKKGIEKLDIRVPMDIDIETSLVNPEKEFRKKIGSVSFKLQAGFSVELGLYLVGSVDGEMSVEVDIDSVIGVTYADGHFAPVSECTATDTVVLSAGAKLGSGVEVGVYFAKDILDAWNKFKEAFGDKADDKKDAKPIVNLAAESGVKLDANLKYHSDASLVCADAAGYLYLSILFAKDCLLDDLLDIDKEWEVLDSDNSPVKITAHAENMNNEGFKKVDECTYSPAVLLSKCTVTLSQNSYVYDGKEKKPVVTVKNGDKVIPSTEYTVSYSDNVNAGTATVTVTAKAGSKVISGSTRKTFTITIENKIVSLSDCTVTIPQDSYVFDGASIKPVVTVKDGHKIIPATEYTVSYLNNSNFALE